MTTTELDLPAIRARVDAATEGPWRIADPLPGLQSGESGSPRYDIEPDGIATQLSGLVEWRIPADADFIAHARTDVPALLDALATAQAELAASQAVIAAVRLEAVALFGPDDPETETMGSELHRILAQSPSTAALDTVKAEAAHDARVVAYSAAPKDSALTLKIECSACESEWGWTTDVRGAEPALQAAADAHNARTAPTERES